MTDAPGAALRREIEEQYDVEGIAAQTLIDSVCRTVDELAVLEAALGEHGPLLKGARGQLVANPALAAIARHRALLGRLVAEAFPGEHETASEQASRAARTRWQRGRQ